MRADGYAADDLLVESHSARRTLEHRKRQDVIDALKKHEIGFHAQWHSVQPTPAMYLSNLGWDEVRFPKPVFHGDTLHIESEVLEIRASSSRPNNGIVVFAHRAFNQRNELVASCKRSALMIRKPK